MSIRSYIGILEGNKVEVVYCNHESYLEYTGMVLNNYYDYDKTLELLKKGAMIYLSETIEKSLFYGDQGSRTHNSLDEFKDSLKDSLAQYIYLYNVSEKKWLYCINNGEGKFFDLEKALKKL